MFIQHPFLPISALFFERGESFSGQRAKANQACGWKRMGVAGNSGEGGRGKEGRGEERVEGEKRRGKERRGEKRKGKERSHIILHLNGNAITSHLIRTVRSTLAGDLLAFISNMNYGSALASKC